jgi:cyclohexanecarboxylate-CoA ligase
MSDAHVRLRATYQQPSGPEWARPGGPWDVPALDQALPAPVELDQGIAALTGGLWDAGVRPGDAVAWQRPNGPDVVLLYRACWRIGAIAAPLHHLAGPADVHAALERLQPRYFVGLDEPLPRSDRPVPPGRIDVAPSDLAVALSTSGSTGVPKVVLHSHRGLVYKARLMAAVHGVGPEDHVLMPAPLAHISGLLNGVLLPGVSGMGVTLMARWQPEAALDVIDREGVTFMVGPPTFFVSLIESPEFAPARTRSLRLVSCGGAGVTPAFVERASRALGCRIKRTYGSTEAPTVTTWTEGEPPERATHTDGRPIGAAEVRVVDPSTSRQMGPGEVGELWLRGPELFVGYSEPTLTRAAVSADGWFRSGDLARIDAAGWVTVVGRLGEVIIRGGENIAAAEIAGVLEAHPSVRQAVVIGLSDDRLGERVAAFVVARGPTPFTLEECRAWCAARGVTRFKWPEVVLQLGDVPLLASGKPDRAALLRHLPGHASETVD